jgi:hypothetical protein
MTTGLKILLCEFKKKKNLFLFFTFSWKVRKKKSIYTHERTPSSFVTSNLVSLHWRLNLNQYHIYFGMKGHVAREPYAHTNCGWKWTLLAYRTIPASQSRWRRSAGLDHPHGDQLQLCDRQGVKGPQDKNSKAL